MKLLIIALLLLPVGAFAQSDQDRYPPPGPDGRIPMSPGDLMMPHSEGRYIFIDDFGRLWPIPKEPRYVSGVTAAVISPEEARAIQIREWAASGEICRVLGHRWECDNIWFSWDSSSGKLKAHPETRRCTICGKTETRRLTEWE